MGEVGIGNHMGSADIVPPSTWSSLKLDGNAFPDSRDRIIQRLLLMPSYLPTQLCFMLAVTQQIGCPKLMKLLLGANGFQYKNQRVNFSEHFAGLVGTDLGRCRVSSWTSRLDCGSPQSDQSFLSNILGGLDVISIKNISFNEELAPEKMRDIEGGWYSRGYRNSYSFSSLYSRGGSTLPQEMPEEEEPQGQDRHRDGAAHGAPEPVG